jgi:hypothetical protein
MNSRFLQISAAAALVMAAAVPARAQASGWLGTPAAYADDDYRTSYADARRSAYDNGYRDGVKRGEQAARDRRPLDVERERDYRQAEKGYNRSFGDRNRYRDNYRGGFAQGYRDGYRRGGARSNNGGGNGRVYPNSDRGYGDNRGYGDRGYGGYGGNANYGAFQNGVADGYKKGLDDVHDRKYPDVTRQKWYRNGDHDYDSHYGSKDAYRVEYRRGFEDGYNRAYREARRY